MSENQKISGDFEAIILIAARVDELVKQNCKGNPEKIALEEYDKGKLDKCLLERFLVERIRRGGSKFSTKQQSLLHLEKGLSHDLVTLVTNSISNKPDDQDGDCDTLSKNDNSSVHNSSDSIGSYRRKEVGDNNDKVGKKLKDDSTDHYLYSDVPKA